MSGRSGLLALQIVYCARAKASTLGDAKVVEEQGPARLAQELQVGHLYPPSLGSLNAAMVRALGA